AFADLYAVSLGTAGDVNGDGYSDVIVGAPRYDGLYTDSGRAAEYSGSADGLATSASWAEASNQADAGFGVSVATAGDVNGDGYSDVIVGAWDYDNGQVNEGRAYVYQGSATGLGTNPSRPSSEHEFADLYAVSLASAGDVNGDRYSDVIVGAHRYD